MARYQKVALNLNADDVWAAAAAAQRINGDYFKTIEDGRNTETNRQLMESLIEDPSRVTDEDREQASAVRDYFKGMMFQVLAGKRLNEFLNSALTISNRDIIDEKFDIAVIASLPSAYIRAKAMDEAKSKIRFANGGYIGAVGNKISCSMEVVKVIFSQRWNSFVVNGITDKDQAVFFFTGKNEFSVGQSVNIQGKVKAHRENQTQLNYVKVV